MPGKLAITETCSKKPALGRVMEDASVIRKPVGQCFRRSAGKRNLLLAAEWPKVMYLALATGPCCSASRLFIEPRPSEGFPARRSDALKWRRNGHAGAARHHEAKWAGCSARPAAKSAIPRESPGPALQNDRVEQPRRRSGQGQPACAEDRGHLAAQRIDGDELRGGLCHGLSSWRRTGMPISLRPPGPAIRAAVAEVR